MQLELKTDDEIEFMLHKLLGNSERSSLNAPHYCTNCNATIPIAFENKVSIRWLDGVNCWVADQQFDNQSGVYSSFSTYQLETGGKLFHQSELRTIVICLIKVLSKKTNLEIAYDITTNARQ